jgi:hypothetical protein
MRRADDSPRDGRKSGASRKLRAVLRLTQVQRALFRRATTLAGIIQPKIANFYVIQAEPITGFEIPIYGLSR